MIPLALFQGRPSALTQSKVEDSSQGREMGRQGRKRPSATIHRRVRSRSQTRLHCLSDTGFGAHMSPHGRQEAGTGVAVAMPAAPRDGKEMNNASETGVIPQVFIHQGTSQNQQQGAGPGV